MENTLPLETHPFPPYIPPHAKVLIMGTFPPQPHRWAMDFYYPNRNNDFWKVMGLIFMGNPLALVDTANRTYKLDDIRRLLDTHGIALSDTGYRVRRLAGNASDKFLEIVEPVDFSALRAQMPELKAVATTGEKAAATLAALTDTTAPAMGCFTETPDGIALWRMPSTSRAYPAPLETKAAYYSTLFRSVGLIQ